MKRTTIWLTNAQVKALAKISKDTGMKQAELIRRCLDDGLRIGVEIYRSKRRKTQ